MHRVEILILSYNIGHCNWKKMFLHTRINRISTKIYDIIF